MPLNQKDRKEKEMLTEVERKILYKIVKSENFDSVEIELMNRMLYLDDELRHEVDQKHIAEDALAELFHEKHEADLKASTLVDEKNELEDELKKAQAGLCVTIGVFDKSLEEMEKKHKDKK
ncbi:hypothetical protein ELI_3138 [Eubacterium callanderi]|uniref:Uncharacterized protein n=2 Tax=Eubacterium callanderi TaxID=53442 RepID=E3GEJ1_9FIRM|nr:hypothetical protein ELI_3138 [Eubacterium callanderi]